MLFYEKITILFSSLFFISFFTEMLKLYKLYRYPIRDNFRGLEAGWAIVMMARKRMISGRFPSPFREFSFSSNSAADLDPNH